MPIASLRCEACPNVFIRAATGAPARWCSKRCRNRAHYLATRGATRSRRPDRRAPAKPRKRAPRPDYDREYNRRPEVRERNRIRQQAAYRPHPRPSRQRRVVAEVPSPYTGHRWLEIARNVVTPDLDRSQGESAEWRQDEMGEALLALLEGRDPKEAVAAYRKQEYVARYMTQHIGEWAGKDEAWKLDALLPAEPSAEDEVIAVETVTVLLKTPYHSGHGKALMGTGRQQQPSERRRRRDAGWRKNAA